MNSIYFWIISPFLYCISMIQGYGDIVPRRSNEVFYKEHQQQQQQRIGAAKYVNGNYQNSAWNSSKRLFGRHVCAQSKVVMVPVKDMQSYCKPMYQSYLRRCDKDGSGYCTGYRVVYELAYRTVQMLIPKTQSHYTCCPGWKQTQLSATDCKAAICREPCRNGGMCTKPDHCTCPPGWTGKTCESDVDECARKKHTCEQECVNTPGSYICFCRDGSSLHNDKKSCKKPESHKNSEDNKDLVRKLESLQQRLSALEDWQRTFIANGGSDNRHPRAGNQVEVTAREDNRAMINSLSEQMAFIEEALDRCSCYRRNSLSLPPPQR